MEVTIGHITFDRVRYDDGGDVLYLHRDDPSHAIDFDESPEGHHLRFDRNGRLIGVTIVGPQRLLTKEGRVTITLRDRISIGADEVGPALSPGEPNR
jgi:uncharacterized protein YuzE